MKDSLEKVVAPGLLTLSLGALPSCIADADYAASDPVNTFTGGQLTSTPLPVAHLDAAQPNFANRRNTVFTKSPLPVLPELQEDDPLIFEGGPISQDITGSGFDTFPAAPAYTETYEPVALSVTSARPLISKTKDRHRSRTLRAHLRGKKAIAPAGAPSTVREAISYGNKLQNKGYRLGGGHTDLNHDSAYDCSGATSYVLRNIGLMRQSMPSDDFVNYGEPGEGKYITIWAKPGHVFMTICGLRLDTGGSSERTGPRWKPAPRNMDGFVARHPADF